MILTVTLNAAIDNIWTIDDFNIGSVFRANKGVPQRVPGGKGINVARVINALRENVLATGFIGGYTGELINKLIKEEKIDQEFIFIKGESRENLIIVDPIKKTETVINGIGPDISPLEIEKFREIILKKILKSEVICLCGSLPPGVPKDFYAYMIMEANKLSIPVILDTSKESLSESIISKPFMIKLNTKEIMEVLPHQIIESDNDIITAAKYFLKKGTESVIITKGAEGAILCTQNEFWKIIPPEVNVLNSVGSGDAFVGGCAVAISKGRSILDAAILGTASGAANAETLIAGDVTYDRIHELINKVVWRRL